MVIIGLYVIGIYICDLKQVFNFTLLILLRHSDSAVKVNYFIFSLQGRKVAV